MYEYKRKNGILKRLIIIILLMTIVSALSIFIYKMYINIDMYSADSTENKQGAIRLSQNIIQEEKENITDILDKTIKCVVGISKIKNTGNSIFLNNSTKELGLGTGMIITDNRIYSYKLACCRKQI